MAEFRFFKREILRLEGIYGKLDFVPALDFEHGKKGSAAAHEYNCRFYIKFCKLLKNEFGNKPLIYTAAWARGLFMNKIHGHDLSQKSFSVSYFPITYYIYFRFILRTEDCFKELKSNLPTPLSA